MKEEKKYSSLYFGGCRLFPLQHAYRQDLTRLPHLALERSRASSFKGMRRYFLLHNPFKPMATLQGR